MSESKLKGSGLEWFVRRGKVVRGPFNSTTVRHFVIEDKLGLEDEVSADRREWRRLGSVPEVVPLQLRTDGDGLAIQHAVERKGERNRAMRSIVVTLLIIGGFTAAVSLIGRQPRDIERDCATAPAPGVFLEGCRLGGADMVGAALIGAHLANSSLAGAKLSEADLSKADLRYANLSGSDMSYVSLSAANLKGANLRLADLTNADLDGADLSFADLGGARLGGASLQRVRLEGAIWIDGTRCGASDCPR
jgi:uncharacterized protein (DUF2237 family)